jgi:hypothetical protein
VPPVIEKKITNEGQLARASMAVQATLVHKVLAGPGNTPGRRFVCTRLTKVLRILFTRRVE